MQRNIQNITLNQPSDWARDQAIQSEQLKKDIQEGQKAIEQILNAAMQQKSTAGDEIKNVIPEDHEAHQQLCLKSISHKKCIDN